jgi:hypothetical protein
MVDITRLHIHWRDLDGKMQKKSIKPTDPENSLMLKKDVADYVSTIKGKAEYYYVVVQIERANGTPAFRTVIPKTLVNA